MRAAGAGAGAGEDWRPSPSFSFCLSPGKLSLAFQLGCGLLGHLLDSQEASAGPWPQVAPRLMGTVAHANPRVGELSSSRARPLPQQLSQSLAYPEEQARDLHLPEGQAGSSATSGTFQGRRGLEVDPSPPLVLPSWYLQSQALVGFLFSCGAQGLPQS